MAETSDALDLEAGVLWGLAAFGQDGVEAVLALLRRELETLMIEMGTPDLGSITKAHVRRAEGG